MQRDGFSLGVLDTSASAVAVQFSSWYWPQGREVRKRNHWKLPCSFSWRCGQKERFLKFWLPVPAAQFPKMALCPDKSLEVKRKKKETKQEKYHWYFYRLWLPSPICVYYLHFRDLISLFFGFCPWLFVVITWEVSGSRHILPQPASEVFPFSLQKEIIR